MKRLLISILLFSCMFAGNASVQVTASNSVLLGTAGGSIPITVHVSNPDGSPAKGVGVIIRVIDINGTGILGSKTHADIMKLADNSGTISGNVVLPPLSSSGLSRNSFPASLLIQAISFRHDWTGDWFAQANTTVGIESAQPYVSYVSVAGEPVQAGGSADILAIVRDVDSDPSASINISGGTLGTPSVSAGKSLSFGGKENEFSVSWAAPKRGLNAKEVALAKSLAVQLPAILSSFGMQYAAGAVPDLSAGNISQQGLGANLPVSSAYSKAGISLVSVNYNFGFLTLRGNPGSLTGTVSSSLASIPTSYSQQTYALSVNASDGTLSYNYIYPLKMQFSGFGGLGS